ncbi:MAG: methylmalonyl-CoA mutase family protein [Planctomycetota bacterium]
MSTAVPSNNGFGSSTISAPDFDPNAVTISGLVLPAGYGPGTDGGIPAALESAEAIQREIPQPGEFPYTRGLFPEGYRTRLWTMRQFAGFGSADDTNNRFKYLLRQAGYIPGDDGVLMRPADSKNKANTGLSTAFDLPTLMGRDSDDALSAGEVGRCGVAIDTIEDMHRLYADLPIDEVTVSQTINGPACVIWAMYIAMASQRGITPDQLGGTLQNDILKEFHSQNEYIYPPEASVKLVADTIEFQAKQLPKWNSVSISGYHIRESGCTGIQELAFTLRDGMEYVEACIERGMDVNDFGPRLSFFFNSHNEFFEEVCKLRAARRIWARMMRDRYKATNPRAWRMKCHIQTAGCSLTEQQPLNNIVRVAYQAMAGVLGWCQSLHTDSMDETLGLPTEQAVTVALRTQQILAHETGVTRTTDPLGGSWFIESLTDKMEAEALDLIAQIDDMGGGAFEVEDGKPTSRSGHAGVVAGIHKGYFRRSIADAAYRYAEECEAKDRIIVGVNEYIDENEERPIDILEIPHTVETDQVSLLEKFKTARDGAVVEQALEQIRKACRGEAMEGLLPEVQPLAEGLSSTNVMPALVNASLAGATMGEMVQAMADVYGRYTGGPEW